jgi:hypothetical protein
MANILENSKQAPNRLGRCFPESVLLCVLEGGTRSRSPIPLCLPVQSLVYELYRLLADCPYMDGSSVRLGIALLENW